MSKKRNTRKHKEKAATRSNIEPIRVEHASPTYSIKKTKPSIQTVSIKPTLTQSQITQKDSTYLRHDMFAITTATGIVIGADLILFFLLTSGGIRLNFLGY